MKMKPVALIIMDGQGNGDHKKGDSVFNAETPILDEIYKKYGSIEMKTFGESVGLPKGQMGNSEVGHTNIGAGRIIRQGLSKINYSIDQDKSFFKNKVIEKWINHAKENKSKLHLLGLISPGGVHSHFKHIVPLVDMANSKGQKVFIHAFTDGRDVSPTSAKKYINELKTLLRGKDYLISTISGRYYAMDRDRKWERIQLSYDAMTKGDGNVFESLDDYIDNQASEKIYDEFIMPATNKNREGLISDNDSIFFINFRPDRARQISHMFIGSKLWDYKPSIQLQKLFYGSMMYYDKILSKVAFEPEFPKNTIGEWLEKNNVSQLRAAETEKYPHVTFFFDGGKEYEWKKQKKILINSPNVATYDLQPEMSAIKLTDEIIANISEYEIGIINYANPDMVGHTGIIPAVIKAVETIDTMVGRLYQKIVKELGGTLLITADHGNADEMIESDGSPMTKHSMNPVLVTLTNDNYKFKNEYIKNYSAKLADIAPTLLMVAGIKIPSEMTGNILIEKK